MKKIILSVVLSVLFSALYAQRIECYSCRPSGWYTIGIGKFANLATDSDGNTVTTLIIGAEDENKGLGFQLDIRNGANYLNKTYLNVNTEVSIDTRYVYSQRIKERSPLYWGAYAQFNSTAMWFDGVSLGPVVQLRFNRGFITAVLQGQLPLWAMEKRALSLDTAEWSRFYLYKWDRDMERTRPTEHRVSVQFLFKLPHR